MEESAFISFITPLQERLFRVAKRLLVSSQEAQDAVGEVTLKLWDKRDCLSLVQNLRKAYRQPFRIYRAQKQLLYC